jgi:hypothetical protein
MKLKKRGDEKEKMENPDLYISYATVTTFPFIDVLDVERIGRVWYFVVLSFRTKNV